MPKTLLLPLLAISLTACEPGAVVDPSPTPDATPPPEERVDPGSDPTRTPAEHGLCPDDSTDLIRPDWWSEESHCKGINADYERLFTDDSVQRIDLTISAENYAASMANLEDLLGGGSGGGPGGGGGGPGSLDDTEDPEWLPVTLAYDGHTWTQVGMRYKGNSSLHMPFKEGIRKLAFRLNFDKFEDEHPELENQRFFGFKKMTFSSGFKDDSLMRDKLAAEIFREAGVPAARSAFYEVYLDTGDGPAYMGLYTMIEDPSDEMLEAQFDDDSGNLYKPEGEGATWSTFIESDFEKTTNEDDSDWSDILTAFDALHGDADQAEAWREGLESVFNVTMFLRWLAINQVIVNWDTYGVMDHNYYIYADPSDGGRFTWFPWDLNEAMLPGHGGVPGSISLQEATDEWPMIRYLMDDSVYREIYRDEVAAVLEGSFDEAYMHAKIDAYHALISPYVVGPLATETSPYTLLDGVDAFLDSASDWGDGLKAHVTSRHLDVPSLADAL